MSLLPRIAAAALTLALVSAGPAAAIQRMAGDGLVVSGQAESFEVFYRAGLAPSDVFCAAGEFAQRYLGAPLDAQLTVIHRLAPSTTLPSRRSVVFHLGPRNDAGPGGHALGDLFLRLRREGSSRTVGHAQRLCQ